MSASLRVVLGLLGLSLLALVVTGAPLYARLCYLFALLLLSSRVWSALALHGVEVRRETRFRRVQVGQVFEERFEVHNTGRWLQPWLEVRDQTPLPGSRGSRLVVLLRGRRRQSYLARTRLVQRGIYPLGPTLLSSGDLFGLFPVSRTLPATSSLLVYPTMVEVHGFPNPPGLLPGGEALRRRTHQVTPNAAGVREYASGDPLNRIHWVSTARRDRLMVKEFELDPLAEVWIFVDAARAAQAALPYSPPDVAADMFWIAPTGLTLPPSTEEYAVSIAASLAQYFLRRGRAVGLVSHGAALNVLPPDRGGRQLGKVLEALAVFHAEGELPLAAVATAQAQRLPRGSTVVLITPAVEERVALAVDVLQRRGLRPVAVLLDAASFGGPPGTDGLAAAIAALNVPVCRVACGADLSLALSAADLGSVRL